MSAAPNYQRRAWLIFVFAVIMLTAVAVLSACGVGGKANEPFQDADISDRNDAPAHVGTMPDGFSNWAAKCDGQNMVYVIFKKDSTYGSLAVVANDPRCR